METRSLRGGVQADWLEDPRVEAVLHSMHSVAFQIDTETGRQTCSPFVKEQLALGNSEKPILEMLRENGLVFPEDAEKYDRFCEAAAAGEERTAIVRLRSADGRYRWCKIVLTQQSNVMLCTITDDDHRIRQEELLRRSLDFDEVCGVFNRRAFMKRTRELLSSAKDKEYYVMRFDIAAFSYINELYGADAGDMVLRDIGERLRKYAREDESYARFGNDVFYMCLSRSREEVIELTDRIGQGIRDYLMPYQIVLTFGIVDVDPSDPVPLETLCDRALIAQRSIKSSYVEKRYAFYAPSMGDTLNREHYMTERMERALAEREFCVYFQPKYDIASNRMIGAEALARWLDPKQGMIPPGDFVPLFERNGFIRRLDEFVWEETCRLLRVWLDRGCEVVPISVNVSRVHLRDMSFCDKIVSICKKYEIPSDYLHLEITESACISETTKMYDIMDKLHGHGFSFQLDDFGSGYSSLSSLKDIPTDLVKIDLNFLGESRRGSAFRDAVLNQTILMLKALGFAVMVEGVETEEQVDCLRRSGCNMAQGFFYARPMSVAEFEHFAGWEA